MGDNGKMSNGKARGPSGKTRTLVSRVDDLEKQLLSARRSSWETAAILRVIWDFLTEHYGKDGANERLGQAFDDLGGKPEGFGEMTGKGGN